MNGKAGMVGHRPKVLIKTLEEKRKMTPEERRDYAKTMQKQHEAKK